MNNIVPEVKEDHRQRIRELLLESDWPIGSRGYNYLRLPEELRDLNLSTLGREVDSRFDLLRAPGDLSGRRVLDICCNIGSMGIEACRRGADYVCGVDVNEKALKIGREVADYLNYPQAEFRCLNLHQQAAQDELLKLDFDLLFCFSAVLHIPRDFVVELMKKAEVIYFEGHDEVCFDYYYDNLFRYLGPGYEIRSPGFSFDYGKRLVCRIERGRQAEKFVSLGLESIEIEKELYGGTTSRVFSTKRNSVIKKYFRKTPGHNPEIFQKQYLNEIYWLKKFQNEHFTPDILSTDEDSLTFECSHVGASICKAPLVPQDWKEQLADILNRLSQFNCIHRDLHADQVMTDGKRVYLIDFSYACYADEENPIVKRVIFHDSPIINQIDFLLSAQSDKRESRLESCIVKGSDSGKVIDYLSQFYSVVVAIDYYNSSHSVIAPQFRKLVEPLFKKGALDEKAFTFIALSSGEETHAGTALEGVRKPFRLGKCIDMMPEGIYRDQLQYFSRTVDNRTIFKALSCYSLGFPGNLWDIYEVSKQGT